MYGTSLYHPLFDFGLVMVLGAYAHVSLWLLSNKIELSLHVALEYKISKHLV